MPAPTNRPFFANFIAAFRARSNPAFKTSSSPTSPASTSLPTASHAPPSPQSAAVPSTSRTISTKATTTSSNGLPAQGTSTSTNTNTTSSHIHAAPLARSPGVSSPLGSLSMSPPGTSTPLRGRSRRGSDSSSSSGGFRDSLGPEKWYIGGRTAAGEEKFYRLGLITASPGGRPRSLDRLSL